MTLNARAIHGFTLLEMLGTLALMAVLSAGAAAVVRSALEDTRALHAGQHQAQFVEGTERYVRENYAALLAATAGGTVAVPSDALHDFLPKGFQQTNAYGQTPCLKLRQSTAGKLDALVVTEGGESIPTVDLAYAAAHAGPSGGQIAATEPTVAQGAFDSWRMDTAAFDSATCTGAPSGNRLASAAFFDGPQSSAIDYLYRVEVPGHPELNAINMPLGMQGHAVAVENNRNDPLCDAADPLSQGRIAVHDTGFVLSCQSGVWRRQGSPFWKNPVDSASALPINDNNEGDVRLTKDTSRAFAWTGGAWTALAVDEAGNLRVPKALLLDQPVTVRDPCAPDGAVSRDVKGLALSCQSGLWRTLAVAEIDTAQREDVRQVVIPSAFAPPPAPIYDGPVEYQAVDDSYMARFRRPVRLDKTGQIAFNGWATMVRSLVNDPTVQGRVNLEVAVQDLDTGATVALSRAMSQRLNNDAATINTTLSKALPANQAGYEVAVTLRWSTFTGPMGPRYDRANYVAYGGAVVEETPLQLGWTLDVFY